jgi:hypothetical protein
MLPLKMHFRNLSINFQKSVKFRKNSTDSIFLFSSYLHYNFCGVKIGFLYIFMFFFEAGSDLFCDLDF